MGVVSSQFVAQVWILNQTACRKLPFGGFSANNIWTVYHSLPCLPKNWHIEVDPTWSPVPPRYTASTPTVLLHCIMWTQREKRKTNRVGETTCTLKAGDTDSSTMLWFIAYVCTDHLNTYGRINNSNMSWNLFLGTMRALFQNRKHLLNASQLEHEAEQMGWIKWDVAAYYRQLLGCFSEMENKRAREANVSQYTGLNRWIHH